MKNRTKVKSYSGQPKFCIPASILQFIKPRPPILEHFKTRETLDLKDSKENLVSEKIFSKLEFQNFPKKQFFLGFSENSYSRKRKNEGYPERLVFFKSFDLKFFFLNIRKFFSSTSLFHHRSFFKKLSSRIFLPEVPRSWFEFLKGKYIFMKIPIGLFTSILKKIYSLSFYFLSL